MSTVYSWPGWLKIAVLVIVISFTAGDVVLAGELAVLGAAGADRGPASAAHSETVPALCRDRQDRPVYWQAAGIQFKGEWQAEELALIVEVLDQFADTFGEDLLCDAGPASSAP